MQMQFLFDIKLIIFICSDSTLLLSFLRHPHVAREMVSTPSDFFFTYIYIYIYIYIYLFEQNAVQVSVLNQAMYRNLK